MLGTYYKCFMTQNNYSRLIYAKFTGSHFIQCEPLIPISLYIYIGYRYGWLTLYETTAYRDIGMSESHCMKRLPVAKLLV